MDIAYLLLFLKKDSAFIRLFIPVEALQVLDTNNWIIALWKY